MTENSSSGLDPELAARLERLAARRNAADGGARRPDRGPTASPASAHARSAGTPTRSRRRKPATGSKVAALVFSLVMTFGLTAAMASSDLQSPIIAASAPPTPSTPSVQVVPLRPSSGGSETQTNHVTPITPGTQATTPTTQATAPTTQAAPAGPTTIDGQVIYNPFGAVQVEATFGADGSITDVKVLQAPNSNRLSVRINNYAVPVLNQEALGAQSAHINGVSGATYTSYGYERSLQSAIDSARAEAVTTLA